MPVHKQPFYRKIKYLKNKKFEKSKEYSKSALSISIYPGLSIKNIKYIFNELKFALNNLNKMNIAIIQLEQEVRDLVNLKPLTANR